MALNEPAERAEFLRYEARLNEVIPGYPQVILCLYDLERFGADVLMDALRTHPMVIVDGMVHDNPYYIEPGKFFVGPGVAPVPRGPAGGDDPLREQLSALRGLLVLSMLLTRQEDEAGILHLVASAASLSGTAGRTHPPRRAVDRGPGAAARAIRRGPR